MKKKLVRTSITSFVLMLGASNAYSTDAFNLVGTGPTSQGMGGVGIGYNVGAASMLTNPAQLSQNPKGSYISVGLDVVSADLKVKNTSTNEVVKSSSHGRNNGPYFGPSFSLMRVEDNYAYGFGLYASDGVGTQYGKDSFLSRTVTNNLDTDLDSFSRLLVVRAPFALSYDFNDQFTIGGSLDAVWTAVNLGLLLDTSQIGTLAANGKLDGSLVPTLVSLPGLSGGYLNVDNKKATGGGVDAWGVSGRIGINYKIKENTNLGAVYNFKTRVGDLKGDGDLIGVSNVIGNVPLSGEVRLKNFEMPASFGLGLSHSINPKLDIALDYKRVFWSDVMDKIDVSFVQNDSGASLNLELPTDYEDTNVYSLGFKYKYSPTTSFLGGIHYADLASPSSGVLAIIPSTPTTNLNAGVLYNFSENDQLGVSIAYGLKKETYNDKLPITSHPIQVSHSQIASSITYSKKF